MSDLTSLSAAAPIAAVPRLGVDDLAMPPGFSVQGPESRFADWLVQGVQGLSNRLGTAEALATQFATGADVPPHQVVLTLEEARLSFQLAMQVRSRLLEGYQELMRMQL
jgi:flagellar hook-basal body complex protein FliE